MGSSSELQEALKARLSSLHDNMDFKSELERGLEKVKAEGKTKKENALEFYFDYDNFEKIAGYINCYLAELSYTEAGFSLMEL
jgi:hypothetical protein